MIRNRQLWIICLFVMAIAGTGGWIYYQQHRYKHFAVHEPGMVYRSAWLAPEVLAELIETYQIRSVVNLCNPDEMTPAQWAGERRAVAGAGVLLHAVPLPNSVDFSPDAWAAHLQILNDPNNYPMLVHCQHGVQRTAMFLTAYDVLKRHKTADASLAVQPMFGHTVANFHLHEFAKSFQNYVDKNPEKTAASPLGEGTIR